MGIEDQMSLVKWHLEMVAWRRTWSKSLHFDETSCFGLRVSHRERVKNITKHCAKFCVEIQANPKSDWFICMTEE